MLMSDRWKANVESLVWKPLQFVSEVSFLIVTLMAWHYAAKRERLKLIACLLAMLMAVASAEHFFHQAANADHIVCPHCADEDRRTTTSSPIRFLWRGFEISPTIVQRRETTVMATGIGGYKTSIGNAVRKVGDRARTVVGQDWDGIKGVAKKEVREDRAMYRYYTGQSGRRSKTKKPATRSGR
jgi:hypothetical protein